MSRIRRVCLAASAVAALAFAIPTSASAISINSTSGDGKYTVTGAWTYYDMSAAGLPRGSAAVMCVESDNGYPAIFGRGFADGSASTPFQPDFREFNPMLLGGCRKFGWSPESEHIATARVQGALILTLTGLAPGENPSATRRAYQGKLGLHAYSSMIFSWPGCAVTVAGPQSVDLNGFESIVVDDVSDELILDLSGIELASTKTAGCPSTVGNRVLIVQTRTPGSTFKGVTVTP